MGASPPLFPLFGGFSVAPDSGRPSTGDVRCRRRVRGLNSSPNLAAPAELGGADLAAMMCLIPTDSSRECRPPRGASCRYRNPHRQPCVARKLVLIARPWRLCDGIAHTAQNELGELSGGSVDASAQVWRAPVLRRGKNGRGNRKGTKLHRPCRPMHAASPGFRLYRQKPPKTT